MKDKGGKGHKAKNIDLSQPLVSLAETQLTKTNPLPTGVQNVEETWEAINAS